MASRSRKQVVKADVADAGFLKNVVTTAILPDKYQPMYYAIMHDLDFKTLDCDRQLLAWQIAYQTCRLYALMDQSSVANDADRRAHLEALEQLPKMQKALIDLINAFHGKRREEPPTEDGEKDFRSAVIERLIGETTETTGPR